MTISEELREMLMQNGALEVGYGDLSAMPEDSRKALKFGVSIVVGMTPEVIRGIESGPTVEYNQEYLRINSLLDGLCAKAVDFLKARSFETFSQDTATVVENETTWTTPLPHKTVATSAGIGWIGDCALLVTENFGSAIRITSVLTNAPLEAASPVTLSRCGSCMVCREVCPGKAVSGKNWSPSIYRDDFFDPFACRKAARERAAKAGFAATLCGLCILKCPWTQRYLNRCATGQVSSKH